MANSQPCCPKCGNSVRPRDLNCPHCLTPLKAHGHPGITIHYAQGNEALCLTCELHADNSCTLAKRPQAQDCTLYLNQAELSASLRSQQSYPPRRSWLARYGILGLFLGIVLVALLLSL